MADILRILISSTAIDLEDHRKAVEDAILRLEHLPIGMERFGAVSQAPVEVCREKIIASDVVVVLVAHRYGWVPREDQGGDGSKSITWDEVEKEAARAGVSPEVRRETQRLWEDFDLARFTPSLLNQAEAAKHMAALAVVLKHLHRSWKIG